MFPVSIRYGIPLLIVVFTAVRAAYTVQREWGAAKAVVRVYYLTSHLNAGAKTRIAGWKVEMARADSFTSPQATPGTDTGRGHPSPP